MHFFQKFNFERFLVLIYKSWTASFQMVETSNISKNTLIMKNFTIYLSTAPVVGTIWFIFTAGLIIEINRFFPDPLIFNF